jgi:anti-sigma-K factor RskA
MRAFKFPTIALLFFLAWIVVQFGLDFASQKWSWPEDLSGWQLLATFLVQIASAAVLAYAYTRAADRPWGVNRRRVLWRFIVLVLAALASMGFMLLVAIAVFSQRG